MSEFFAGLAGISAADFNARKALAEARYIRAEDAPKNLPLTTQQAYQKYPEGTRIRDFLSGKEGEVAKAPEGDFGEVVFMKPDGEEKIYAVRLDQIQVINAEPAAVAPPVNPEPAAAGILPTSTEAAPVNDDDKKASGTPVNSSIQSYRQRLAAARELRNDPRKKAADAITDSTPVVATGDVRRLTFAHLKAHLKALPAATARAAAEYIGYITSSWDATFAALERDGIKLAVESRPVDVKAMLADEIRMMACAASGPVLAAVNAKLAGTGPTSPKPTQAPPSGMTWVWVEDPDPAKASWQAVKASLTSNLTAGLKTRFVWGADGSITVETQDDRTTPLAASAVVKGEGNDGVGLKSFNFVAIWKGVTAPSAEVLHSIFDSDGEYDNCFWVGGEETELEYDQRLDTRPYVVEVEPAGEGKFNVKVTFEGIKAVDLDEANSLSEEWALHVDTNNIREEGIEGVKFAKEEMDSALADSSEIVPA